MKIAIDISPVIKSSNSAHKVRGVGAYINMLIQNLAKYDGKNEYVFVEDKSFPKNADLIHYPYFDPFFLTLPFKSPQKFVVTVHDLTPIAFPDHFPAGFKGNMKWQVQKRLLKKASCVITDSNCSKKDIQRIIGVSDNKVKTVYLAADQTFKKLKLDEIKTSQIQKKYNLPESFILYVGDATWNKNLSRLVEAVKKTNVTLVMVGKIWGSQMSDVSSNKWNDDLKKVLREINTTQFVKLGFVPNVDLIKIYNLASALVMPSIYEGFGLPVLEAMNCGCPVITTKEGSLEEVGGNAVYYVDALDSKDIANGISKLINDGKLRQELSEKGLKQAEIFTVKKSIKDLVTIYESTT